ncbi:helix-turn-helix domain-containing protein [Alloacidobacterium dinghuense]|uniref:Helix-turn-helix domain-containing protein n=1 Tax=Alloacidobacterium dinghuense TaxID=2763107 RepID=A0A7G8BE53_9BACT|nr:helix-turn-helix domain-containing protein [Alloacidobacterium dinghuense]
MNVEHLKSQPQFEPLVSAEVAGKYLGFSGEKVRQMAREGTIPCVPFPGRKRTVWRFRISDLQEYVTKISNGVRYAEEPVSERVH